MREIWIFGAVMLFLVFCVPAAASNNAFNVGLSLVIWFAWVVMFPIIALNEYDDGYDED
jgi:hypothetical protein